MTMLYRITLLRSAKRFHVATVCFLLAALSANGVMVIGCGPGKSGSKQTTVPQRFAGTISQAVTL
jgi:hypothetical protein